MRALYLTFVLVAFAALFSFDTPAPAADCSEIRGACRANCGRGVTSASRIQACLNRCSVIVCRDTPSVCTPTDQNVCQDDFRSCNGACAALASLPSAAATVTVEVCARRCCNNLRICLGQRQCDVGGFSCR
jgi:hypothetical protein